MENRIFSIFFDDSEQEDHCEICELIDPRFEEIIHSESEKELRLYLHSLVEEAFRQGYINALEDDIDVKVDLINNQYEDFG